MTARDERSAMLSPDGRWMVYTALEPGRDVQVYVQPFRAPASVSSCRWKEGGSRFLMVDVGDAPEARLHVVVGWMDALITR